MGLDNYPLRRLAAHELEDAEIAAEPASRRTSDGRTLTVQAAFIKIPASEQTFGPFEDAAEAERVMAAGLWTQDVGELWDELPSGGVVGMMFGGPGWIRGRYYNELVEPLTGISLYGNGDFRVEPAEVKQIAASLEQATASDIPVEYTLEDLLFLRAYFRILAEHELALACWY